MAGKTPQDREARRRLQQYEARTTVHETKMRRRRRDNVLAVIGLIVVAALATTAQVLFFSAGPGTPEPEPSASIAPSDEPAAVEPPDAALSEFRTWSGAMTINDDIELGIELDGVAAPQAVASFVSLVQDGFYDDLTCHRLVTDGIFVLQCGDPSGDGTGGPEYRFGPIENAPTDDVYAEGTLAMARQGGNGESMGSQFFIVYDESTIPSDAAGGYTRLGTVTSGLSDLVSGVVEEGTANGATDGPPAQQAIISGITIE